MLDWQFNMTETLISLDAVVSTRYHRRLHACPLLGNPACTVQRATLLSCRRLKGDHRRRHPTNDDVISDYDYRISGLVEKVHGGVRYPLQSAVPISVGASIAYQYWSMALSVGRLFAVFLFNNSDFLNSSANLIVVNVRKQQLCTVTGGV